MSTYGNTPRLSGGMSLGMGVGALGLGLGGQAQGQSQTTRSRLSSPFNLQTNIPKPTIGGGGGGLFLSSDDHLLTKQIEEKHAPDGTQVDVRPLLHLVQDILTNATQTNSTLVDAATDQVKATITATTQVVQQKQPFDSKMLLSGFENMPDLPIILERLSCEMSCKCLGGTPDAHGVTLSVLNTLSRFTWEAKLVLTLAAFALSYGDFWLLAQIYTTNPLAKSIAILKQLPTIMEHSSDSLKRQFEVINNLIKSMLDVTKMVVDFNELPSEYISQDEPVVEAAMNQFPLAVYYTIRSSVSAASQITVLTSVGHEYMPSTNEMELSNWTNKLNFIFGHLGKIKDSIVNLINSKKEIEAYIKIKKTIYSIIHSDNMTVLKMLIYGKDDIIPLYDGSTKKRVQIDIMRGKTTLLLITSLDIPTEELSVLEKIHNDSKTHAYEIIWVPVVDRTVSWSDALQSKFESLQALMPWYSVHHPSIIDGSVIRFFREDWNFKGEPILVGLDNQGKVISPNALPMMWIWGSKAFPFTTAREETLWKEESWKLDLLVGSIDHTVQTWMEEDKYVFLFGGDDIEWIRRFTKEARSVIQSSNINVSNIEFLYVGKSCKKVDSIRKIISTIENEKLCNTVWKDTSKIWFFWTRLQSMLHSKIQLDKVNDLADTITPEIKKLISYDKNASGMWALLAKGPNVVLSGPGSTIYTTLSEFDQWKMEVNVVGFEAAFFKYHQKVYLAENPCCRFEFPTGSGKIPVCMNCPECNNAMQHYTTFICCHEGAAAAAAATSVTDTTSITAAATSFTSTATSIAANASLDIQASAGDFIRGSNFFG